MVGVLGIGFTRADHATGCDEARDVVDVSVCIVALDAGAEPDRRAHAEQIERECGDRGLVDARVALGIEQRRFGREQCSLAIDLDRTALEHDAGPLAGDTDLFRDLPGNGVIAVER